MTCINCNNPLPVKELLSLSYCDDCYKQLIMHHHNYWTQQALAWDDRLSTAKQELEITCKHLENIRKEAIRCGFRIGADVKETPKEDNPSDEPTN